MSAAFDFTALMSTTDQRDAGLLELVAGFSQLNDTSDTLVRRVERLKEDGCAYKRLWKSWPAMTNACGLSGRSAPRRRRPSWGSLPR